MSMSEMIHVVVAPGNVLTIAHPSGIPGLPAVQLLEGDRHVVTTERAARLYRDGMILHPVTGQPPRAPAQRDSSLQVVTDGRSYEDMARLATEAAPPPPDDYWAKHPILNVVPNDITLRNGVL